MLQALAPQRTTMFGVDSFYDGMCYADYDPYQHAESIGARLVSNMTLPDDTPAAYSHQLDIIFFRADLLGDEERCALAHEIVHYEHKDNGKNAAQEDRANRISTLRLIRPSRLSEAMEHCGDLAEVCRELNITENVMRLYARMARNGTLPK